MARPLASLRSRVFAATTVVAVVPLAAALVFVTGRVGQQAEVILQTHQPRHPELLRLLESGYVEGHGGRMGTRGRFSYFVHPELPSGMVELSETTGGKGEYFRQIAEAARTWDGRTEPVRQMGASAVSTAA